MKLPKLEDKSGVLTQVLCFLLLVSYHASRDALITVLPSISACNTTVPPDAEHWSSIRHPLVAATTRVRRWNAGGSLGENVSRYRREDVSRYLRDAGRFEDYEKSNLLRLEREVQGSRSGYLQNLTAEINEDYAPESKSYVRNVGGVRSTPQKNVGYGQGLRKTWRDHVKTQNGEIEDGDSYSTDLNNTEVIAYIRQSLLAKGYDVSPSLVRELWNFQNQLDAARFSRNNLNGLTSSENISRNSLSIPNTSSLISYNDNLTSGTDVSGGNHIATHKTGGSEAHSTNAENDSGAGTVDEKDYREIDGLSAVSKESQGIFVSEEQLLKLMKLLDYIDEEEAKRDSRMPEAAIQEEENLEVCDYYEFRGLMFLSSWPLAVQGSVLAGVHLTSIIGLFVGHYCIEISTVQDSTVGAVFTLQMALLLLVTEEVTKLGAVALVAIRAWQGLVQGACYPVVYSLLENKKIHGRLTLCIIFSGPWLGSTLGSSLGTQPYWAVAFYASGGIVLVVGVLFIFLQTTKVTPEVPCRWGEVMRRDVLVSSLVHGGAVWVLHTVLLASTLVVEPDDRWWVLLTVLLAGGLVAQLLDAAVEPAIPQLDKPARRHLLVTTVISFSLTIASLLVLALTGDSEEVNMMLFVLVGGVVGTTCGYGVSSIGYREVLEAVEARRRSKALVVTNVAGAFGASVACWLLLPMVQAGSSGGYITGCVLPLSAVSGGAVCVFMFLLFPKTPDFPYSEGRPSVAADGAVENGEVGEQPEGVYVIPTPATPPLEQARAPPDGMSQRSGDNRSYRSFRSFKSAMSTATFKTAVSRPRAASISTVYEDLDDVSLECKSVALESSDEVQPREGLRKLEVPTSYSDLLANEDKTSAWLQVHHRLDVPRSSSSTHDPSVTSKPLPGLLF